MAGSMVIGGDEPKEARSPSQDNEQSLGLPKETVEFLDLAPMGLIKEPVQKRQAKGMGCFPQKLSHILGFIFESSNY